MLKLGTDPANIRLGQDVLKTSWRRLEDVFSVTFFCLPRRLENVLKTSWRHNCKTSCKHVWKTSWRRLEDVLKTPWKTSWRRLEDVLGRRIANTSWRRLGRRKVLRWRRLGKQEMFAGELLQNHKKWKCETFKICFFCRSDHLSVVFFKLHDGTFHCATLCFSYVSMREFRF